MTITYKQGNVVDARIDGEIRKSKNYGEYRIISAVSKNEYLIEFINTGYSCVVNKSNLLKGEIKDKLHPTIAGIGYIGSGDFDSKHIAYPHWISMLKRCYTELSDGSNLSYLEKGVGVSVEWYNFQNFAKWFQDYLCNHKIDYAKARFNLDKDILNTTEILEYNKHNCCIVPEFINNFYKDISNARGWKLNKSKTKPYTVSISGKWLKDFSTKSEAVYFYGSRKCAIFKEMISNIDIPDIVIDRFIKLFKEKFNVDF